MATRVGRQTKFFWAGTVDPTNVITGIREINVEANGEPVNITAGDDAGVQQLIANISAEDQVTITISGVTKDITIRDDWYGGTRSQTLQILYPDTSTIAGTFFISSYSEGEPYNDAATFEATFMSSGTVTLTPA